MDAGGHPSVGEPSTGTPARREGRSGRDDGVGGDRGVEPDVETLVGALACLGEATLPSWAFRPAGPVPGQLGSVLRDPDRLEGALMEAEARGWLRRGPDGWRLSASARKRLRQEVSAAARAGTTEPVSERAAAVARWLETLLPRDPEDPEGRETTGGAEVFGALLPHILPAVRAAAESGAPLDAALLAAARAAAHQALNGEAEAAADLLGAALDLSQDGRVADPFLRAVLADQWASALQDLGRDAEARSAAARAEAIAGSACRPGEPRRAALMVNVGTIYKRQGDFLTAEVHFRRALSELDAAGPEGAGYRTPVCLNLCDVLRAQAKAPEALKAAERAVREAEAALGPVHQGTADALESLALAREAVGETAAARPVWRRVAALYARQLGPAHPLAEAAALRAGDPPDG